MTNIRAQINVHNIEHIRTDRSIPKLDLTGGRYAEGGQVDGDVGYRPSQEERLGEAVVESFADEYHGRSLRRHGEGMDDDDDDDETL